MEKIKLLPCPFCGGEAKMCGREFTEFYDGEWSEKPKKEFWVLAFHAITCVMGSACSLAYGSVGGAAYVSEEAAANAWNTRASSWIPCSERMPEESGEYLCYSQDGDVFDAYFDSCVDDEFPIGEWQQPFDPVTMGWMGDRWIPYDFVTHWQPLPEPPEGATP